MKEELVLIGGGGHCKSCIDIIEQGGTFQIVGIVDVSENLHQKILGYDVIGTDNDLPRLVKKYRNFLITLGQIKSPQKRIRLFGKIKKLGWHNEYNSTQAVIESVKSIYNDAQADRFDWSQEPAQ